MPHGLWLRLRPTRRRVVMYVIGILALLLLRVVADLWAGYRLASVTTRLAPIYKGLDMASLAPPAVGPAENRARVLAAAAALTVVQNDIAKRGVLSAAISGGSTAGGDTATRQLALRQMVSDNRIALAVLDEAESRPKSNWEITYRNPLRMRLPSLLEIRDLGSLNVAAGLVELGDGRADEAVRRVRLGLVLAGSLTQEPNMIVQLIRFAVTRDDCRLLREVLTKGDPSASALQSVAVPLQDEAQDLAITGFIGELKYQSNLFDGFERGGRSLRADGTAASTGEAWLVWVLRPGVRAAHARLLEQMHQLIEYARLQPFERRARGLRPPSQQPQPWWWRPLTMLSTAALEPAVQSGDEHRALTTVASTAVALRRCRLERGSYPTSLDELVPALLPRVPVDPYTGRAPEYKRSGAGFDLRVIPQQNADGTRGLLDWRMAR